MTDRPTEVLRRKLYGDPDIPESLDSILNTLDAKIAALTAKIAALTAERPTPATMPCGNPACSSEPQPKCYHCKGTGRVPTEGAFHDPE